MAERRILLIDYHFGPGATGGFRWRAMATHLAAEGWRFDVITDGPDRTNPDRGEPFADGIQIFTIATPQWVDDVVASIGRAKRGLRGRRRAPSPSSGVEPTAPVPAAAAASHAPRPGGPGIYTRLASAINAIRITSHEWGWGRRATRLGIRLAHAARYDAVLVSSPPHLTQLAGAAISRAAGLPYVADFRDPWVFGRAEKYDVNALANPLGKLFEPRTLRRASLIICNTEQSRKAVADLYPDLASRTLAVWNGYDADAGSPANPDRSRFRIVFTGWLYPFMDPEAVIAAAGRLRRRAGLAAAEVSVEFMGCGASHGGVPLAAMAARHGIADCLRLLPQGPRAEARRLQQAAAVLVAYDASTQLAMPTKFFDYAQMGGVMLLMGFTDGAFAASAGKIGVRVHDQRDEAGLDAVLDEALRRWRAGDLIAPADREGVFDRRRQSALVREALVALER